MSFTIDLPAFTGPAALVEPDDEWRPQQILLVINWVNRSITVETRMRCNDGCPETRWRGLEDAYVLPPNVDATELRDWIEREVVPRATPLAEAFRVDCDGMKCYGCFTDAREEKFEFDRWISVEAEPPQHDLEIWGVREWVDPGEAIDLGLAKDTADEGLEALADVLLEIANYHRVVLVGGRREVLEYLRELRDTLMEGGSKW